MITRAQIIPPDQTWFWSERWQRMEKAAQADLDSDNVAKYETVEDAIAALDQIEVEEDAED